MVDVIRVPNLPTGPIVREDGFATDDELTFRQSLITSLQDNFGSEGLVAPSQSTSDITIIQDNRERDPVDPLVAGPYTCAAGTIIYDSDTDELKVAILVAGVPTFKVFTVV